MQILNVDKIEKYYGNKGNITKAIDNISFEVSVGEFVGLFRFGCVGNHL